MLTREPQSPRLAILAVILQIMTVISVSGQEFTPTVESRVDSLVDDPAPSPLAPPLDPSFGEKRTQEFNLGAIISGAYDDNIFLSSKDAKSDFVTRISPSISYQKGDRESQRGGFLKFAYRPTGVIYQKNSDDSRVDHEASVAVGVSGKKWAFDYRGAYSRLGDATADTGRQTERNVLDQVVRIAWIPREKLAVELSAGQSFADYADKVLLDSREAFGEIAIRYAYSPKTRVGLAYRAGRFEVDGSDDQKFQRMYGTLEWQPREKIRVELSVGAENREVANGTSLTPVFEGRVEWKPAEKTNLYLAAYRREMASAFSPGQNYRATGASAGISQQIGKNWKAKLEAGVERASYRQVDGEGENAGRDDVAFIRPSIEYRLTEQLGLEVFYRASTNDSSRADFGYDQNSAGISLEYKF